MLVTDVDEIVAPRLTSARSGTTSTASRRSFVNCLGYELIHLVDREGPFDPARKVLDQRGHWFANDIYDKPALTTRADALATWTSTERWTGRCGPIPISYLIHLHRMDYEICLARHRYRQARAWNERDVELGWARHNRITDDAEFARWFYEDSNVGWTEIVIEPIPAAWRDVF